MRKSALRIGQEMSSLSTSLPLGWASSVFIVTDDTRIDVIRQAYLISFSSGLSIYTFFVGEVLHVV